MNSTLEDQLIALARSRIGLSNYRRNAALHLAPGIVNCYRFTQWLWGAFGVPLPDHQLVWKKALIVPLSEATKADLVFAPRRHYTLETDDFGHVGIVTGEATVVHATKWRAGFVEEPLPEFVARGCLGIRRVPPDCRR